MAQDNTTTLDALLAGWRHQAATAGYRRERDKGTAFENLCMAYLQHDPVQARQYEPPVLYSDWAQASEGKNDRVVEPLGYYAPSNRSAQDLGIDLVAKLRDGDGWCAIQCKFHAKGSRISKAEIDSFLAASGHKDFRQRLIIDTTGREWSTQAEEMLRNQAVPVRRIGLRELQASPIRWQDFATSGEIRFADQRKLRPHQRKAMKAVTSGLADPGSRGKMIMACGTGKTLTSLRIAEKLVGTGGRVLYLVPSLALMAQTVPEWARDANIPLRLFAVCSDSQVGKRRRRNDDLIDLDALDLAFPATTDAVRFATVAVPPTPDALTVVFATYQSSPVIEEAQKTHGLPVFNLAVCDEAHRTTGALIEGEDPSHFVRIHRDDHIRCDRRLYMTATPKVYAASARTRAGDLAAALCSMEDEDIYGPLFYELTFGVAVEQGLLTDYKVIVLTVPEDAAARAIQRSLAEDGELNLDDGAKLLGCWRALAKVDADQFPVNDREGMRRAIAFCRDIKSSQQVERLFARVAEEYREKEGADLTEYPVAAQHVDGTFNATRRSVALNWLEEADSGCRVLTNARCLSEGVDVPALDAILFMHPRKSQIDVVQAVGRVMRKVPDKQMGYIVLPVVIPSGIQPEAALNDNKAFEVVWQTLNAIRSHDERFEGMINRLDLGEAGDHIGLITLADWNPAPARTGDKPGIGQGATKDSDATIQPESFQSTLFDGLPEAIRAKIVEKCGDRKYWDEWAGDVADIARRHIERIRAIVQSGEAEREIFQDFVTELRDDLNEGITDDDAIEMLAQHSVTGPVFDALFGETEFVSRNPVSRGIQDVLDVLKPANIEAEAAELDEFYASVRRRVAGANTDEAKQKIVVELYDKFFRNAFPSMTQRLGIVYTPVEIVDFIIRSVSDVLEDEFASTLGSKGVHILDPFTGTGTFVTRLLQSGLIAPKDLPRKYANEIHANEIVLLAYYIAAVNIETAFHEIAGGEYKPLKGICLADTFEMQEGDDLLAQIMPDNSGRRTRQKETVIRVIVGNPPWSAGQRSANDNAANQEYPGVDGRIEKTYAKYSRAQLKRFLQDSYIRAIRWASDRIGISGVIGFVTNAGWIDGNAMDGMRKCLAEEFSSLFVFHLRGNQRTQGERSRQEGGKVFGSGSRAPVAITIFVKNPEATEHGRILFHDIGDYLDQEAKLKKIRQFDSIRGITQSDGWTRIWPDANYDWLGQGDTEFGRFTVIGSKKEADQEKTRFFRDHSHGVATNRDAWCYNFSSSVLEANIRAMIGFYNSEVARFQSEKPGSGKEKEEKVINRFINNDPKKISWTVNLKAYLRQENFLAFDEGRIAPAMYRPFTRHWLYFSRRLNERVSQMPQIFPHMEAENRLICVPGIGSQIGFSALMIDAIPNLHTMDTGQCFSLYLYDKLDSDDSLFGQSSDVADPHNYTRRDAITDDALAKFRTAYGKNVSKHDIFHYIYGLLHVPGYRQRFANNLTKELPRIPLASATDHFTALVAAGRELGDLHVGFDRVDPWPLEFANGGWDVPDGTDPATYFRVQKMKLGGTQKEPDLTTIIYNSNNTITDIPVDAWNYEVNGRPGLKWVMDRQAVSTDKASGIVNDPNCYATETIGDPAYPLKLLSCVIRVSMETNRIVQGLPEPEWA